jgi:AraC family transcriptional activator FtrA
MKNDKDPQHSANLPHKVVLIGYEGLRTFEFGCAIEIFGLERPELGVDWYDFAVCSIDGQQVSAFGGIDVTFHHGAELIDEADTLILPGWCNVNAEPLVSLLDALRRADQRGARICSICTGAFVLAASGILKGKRVTTHWHFSELLAHRYPNIKVDATALYIQDGNTITSAGSAAGLDMMISVVRSDFGNRVANMVAQRLVISAYRDGGQMQVISQESLMTSQTRIAQVMDKVRGALGQSHTVASLASSVGMSPRTFQRTFKNIVGIPVTDWMTDTRISQVKEMLITTTLPIATIAFHCGFSSESTLRHHFKQKEGIAPSQFRRINKI